LQVLIDSPGGADSGNAPMRLRGTVVRIEPARNTDETAVGIVFTD
jgi:hypothetical protein